MQINIRGELTLAEIRQAIYEKLNELEHDFAVAYSRGATIYVNPTDGEGHDVQPRTKDGRALGKITCDGPYRSVADDLKL